MGVTTRVYFALTYAVFVVAGLVLPVELAASVGATFGSLRSLGVWPAYRATSLDGLRAEVARRERRRPLARVANAGMAAVVGVSIAISILGG